jgi:hypothetical protein
MPELENIENVEEVEVIPTDNTTNDLQENVEETTGEVSGEVSGEVTEPEDNFAEIEAEQERLRQEHEEYLNSFPETTVFYRDLLVNGNVKSLGTVVRDPHVAEQWGFLDNHFDESELTYIGTPECGTYYLKGYEKPEKSLEELQLERYHLIDSQIEAYLDARVKEHNYKSVESCVSYFNSTDDKYRAEARAVSTWRDHIYHTGEQVWQSVLNGLVDYKDVDLAYIINIAGDFSWENNV